MPARCTKGFVFEEDLTSVTLHASLIGQGDTALPRRRSTIRSLTERWRLHCETCPRCSRSDTELEACLREEYQWKRAQLHGALSCDTASRPTARLIGSPIQQARTASLSTRLLLGELEGLRRLLLQ